MIGDDVCGSYLTSCLGARTALPTDFRAMRGAADTSSSLSPSCDLTLSLPAIASAQDGPRGLKPSLTAGLGEGTGCWARTGRSA